MRWGLVMNWWKVVLFRRCPACNGRTKMVKFMRRWECKKCGDTWREVG